MGIIATLVIGLIVGILAKFLMPGRDPGGFVVTTLLGIAGAFVAHSLGRILGLYTVNEPTGLIASVLGAMILLGSYRAIAGRQAPA